MTTQNCRSSCHCNINLRSENSPLDSYMDTTVNPRKRLPGKLSRRRPTSVLSLGTAIFRVSSSAIEHFFNPGSPTDRRWNPHFGIGFLRLHHIGNRSASGAFHSSG